MKPHLAFIGASMMFAASLAAAESKAQDFTRTFTSPLLDITVGVQFGPSNYSGRLQTSFANVYGVGQVGRNNQAYVIQDGVKNVAHIVQVGPNASAGVIQDGFRNHANIVQIANGWAFTSGAP